MGLGHGSSIVRNGLVLHLDAGNPKSYPGTGTTWTDVSGKGNNGTLTNGPTFNNRNIVFDGSNDYVSVSRPSTLVAGGSITVCMWAKWTSTGTTVSTIQTLIDNNHTINRGFVIQDRPDLGKTLTWSATVSAVGAQSTFVVGDGQWHFIAGTNDGVNSKLYIDGILNNEVTESPMVNPQPTVYIGSWVGTGRFVNGNISVCQLYSRALTAAEVKQNFEATRGRYGI